MISESTFTTAQVLRDLETLLRGIDRTESTQANYLYLSLRNTLAWLPVEADRDNK